MIITAGRSPILSRTIESLALCRQPERFCGVIVVENGHEQFAPSVIDSYLDALKIEYLYTPFAGKCRALNLALNHAPDNALLLFTDNDIRFDENWIDEYDQASKKHIQGYFYGGSFGVDYETSPENDLIPLLPDSAKGRDFETSPSKPIFLGFNWAVFANDLKRIGGFDESIGPGSDYCKVGDETDAQRRLLLSGVQQISVPSAYVWHFVPSDRCSRNWLVSRSCHVGVATGYLDFKRRGILILLKCPILFWEALYYRCAAMTAPSSQSIKHLEFELNARQRSYWFVGVWNAISNYIGKKWRPREAPSPSSSN